MNRHLQDIIDVIDPTGTDPDVALDIAAEWFNAGFTAERVANALDRRKFDPESALDAGY
jgi:hypothetical protein